MYVCVCMCMYMCAYTNGMQGIGPTVARGVMTTIGQLAVYNVVKDSIEEAGLLSDGIILHFW